MSIAEKLSKLLNIKGAIKEALFYVGQEVADKMEDWAAAIRNICNVPFENLGYTEEQARHCRYIIQSAYKGGVELQKLNKGEDSLFFTDGYNINVCFTPNLNLLSGVTAYSYVIFNYVIGTFPNITEITNSNGRYNNYYYIDLNIPNCTTLNGFQDLPSLVYVKTDVTNIKDMNYFLRTLSIGAANKLMVIRIKGLGTQPESSSWIGLQYKNRLGKPSGLPDDIITVNARQDLVDSLLTNSFDRASAGYSVFTITLSQETFNLLTEEEITAITNKGYTITVG